MFLQIYPHTVLRVNHKNNIFAQQNAINLQDLRMKVEFALTFINIVISRFLNSIFAGCHIEFVRS